MNRIEQRFADLNASGHKGFVAYIGAGDPDLESTHQLAVALDAAGVDVTATRYNGMIHDFGLLNALAGVPATRAALHQASEELKARLK